MKKPTHKIYRTTNWPAYNRALMSRGNIAIWFDPATQWYAPSKGKQGRNQIYSDAAIQCCLMIKSLFRLSLRIVTGFVQSLIKLCGLNWTPPDYTTLCRRQKHIDIAISYQKSSNGLHLLMDSTGMKFLGEGEWKRKKHGPEYRRQWRKLRATKPIILNILFRRGYFNVTRAKFHSPLRVKKRWSIVRIFYSSNNCLKV